MIFRFIALSLFITLTNHHKYFSFGVVSCGHAYYFRTCNLIVCIWCIWCGIFIPYEPPQAAALFNTKGLPSGLDRTRGVVEHYR